MLLQGKNAVITGCGRGIGKAILAAFAEQGANAWACARRPDTEFEKYTRGLSKKNNVEIRPLYFDLADAAGMASAVRKIRSAGIPVDILVNNAGVYYAAPFQASSMARLREMFEVNFFSLFLLTRHISRLMVRQGSGSIINIASTVGMDANPGKAAYGASKAAVICMTKAVAAELAGSGVRANSIAPGLADTDMLPAMTGEELAKIIGRLGIRRPGRPGEIAAAALFLASDLSSYVTGQVLRVDGGLR